MLMHWSFVTRVDVLLLLFLTVASSVSVGLFGVWAALGQRPHWSVRCGILLGVISLGLLIPAHELVAMFLVQSLVVLGVLAAYRVFQKLPDGGRRGFQFSLLDILLFTALTALIMGTACVAPKDTWTIGQAWFLDVGGAVAFSASPHEVTFYLSFGVLFGFATLIACWVVLSKRRLWVRLAVLVLACGIAPLMHYFHNFQAVSPSLWPFPYIPTVTAVVASTWLFLARGSGWVGARDTCSAIEQRMAGHASRIRLGRWACRLACATLSLAMVLSMAGVLYLMATPPPSPQATLPVPNAYDTFVRVGKEFETITIPNWDKPGSATKESLAAFEREFAALLDQAHEALRQECRVPMVYGEDWSYADLSRLQTLRMLGAGFAAEGSAAEMAGDDTRAVQCYLAKVKMGKAMTRGGIDWDAMGGFGIERFGLHSLHDLRDSLSAEQLTELSATLRSMQDPEEPFEVFAARCEIGAHYIGGWEGRLHWILEKLSRPDHYMTKLRNSFDRRQSYYRILLIEIALTQYCNNHGRYPEKLEELVPEFLDELPEEPHGAVGFVYRKKDAKGKPIYELYSTGPNRQDDGGSTSFDIGFF